MKTMGVCRVWCTQKWRLFDRKGLLKRGDHDLLALDWRSGHGDFCSDPLKRHRKPPGNESHTDDGLTLRPSPCGEAPEKEHSRPLTQKAD